MNKTKKCTICKEDLLSDSLGEYHCELCGMLIQESVFTLTDSDRNSKKFCCKSCATKYASIHNIPIVKLSVTGGEKWLRN